MVFAHWPGGIPPFLTHDEIPLPWDCLGELTKGWQLFVEEKYRRDRDHSLPYDTLRRRTVILEWVLVSQETRDRYQSRAEAKEWTQEFVNILVPEDERVPHFNCFCIASLRPSRNRSLWTKLRILWHTFGQIQGYTRVQPNTTGAASWYSDFSVSISPDGFMRWFALEVADFSRMAMTVHGTVVYHWRGPMILADQDSLETGSLLITEFESNGHPGMRMRCSPFHIEVIWSLVLVMGKPVEVAKEFYGVKDIEEPVLGEELDMEMPLLDIFAYAATTELPYDFSGGREQWTRWIEAIAPGYLQLEYRGVGTTGEYNHAKFSMP